MSRNIRRTTLATLMVAGALAGLPATPAAAYTSGPTPAATTTTVSAGEGDQTDPHVSGSLVSYTNISSSTREVRYHDLATGSDAAIPTGGNFDSLSDVSGTTIVFRRVYTDGTARPAIMAFDTATGAPPVVLDPQPGVRRDSPEIGGRTVAWEVAGTSSFPSEIVVYDLDTGVATPLTADGNMDNHEPAVSADGSVVTWSKCTTDAGGDCDVYRAARAGGTWSTIQLTDSTGGYTLNPDTNGERVVYHSNAAGDFDISWKTIDGSQEGSLRLPGEQYSPSVSGDLVAFESKPGATNADLADLWLYDLGTETLYQLTDTPDVREFHNDVSLAPDGTVRVVWAQPGGPGGDDFFSSDVFALSFRLDANRPPECAGVAPSTARLWPPNHQMSPVSLAGASDPDGDPVTLTITAVTQDEPVDGVDDGATAPDAQLGPAPDGVLLRAERSGSGDGRVYRLAFTVADPEGATCSGVVSVGVPLAANGTAVDSGASYDSLGT